MELQYLLLILKRSPDYLSKVEKKKKKQLSPNSSSYA